MAVRKKSQLSNRNKVTSGNNRPQFLSQQQYNTHLASKLSNTMSNTKLRHNDGYAIFTDGSSTLFDNKAGYRVVVVPLHIAHMAFMIHERIATYSSEIMTADEQSINQSNVVAEILGTVETDTIMQIAKRGADSEPCFEGT